MPRKSNKYDNIEIYELSGELSPLQKLEQQRRFLLREKKNHMMVWERRKLQEQIWGLESEIIRLRGQGVA